MTAATSDSALLGQYLVMICGFTGSLVGLVVACVLLARVNWQLGLLVMVGMPLVMGSQTLLARPMARYQDKQRSEQGKLSSIATDAVSGLRILTGIGAQQAYLQRYREQSGRVKQAGFLVANLHAVLELIKILLPGLFTVAVVWVGGLLVVRGQLSAGQLVAAFGYTTFLAVPMGNLAQFIRTATRAQVAFQRLARALDALPATGFQPGNNTGTTAGTTTGITAEASAIVPAAGGLPSSGLPSSGLPAAPPLGLFDPATGVRIAPGQVTAVVSADPAPATALLERLGGMDLTDRPVRLTADPRNPLLSAVSHRQETRDEDSLPDTTSQETSQALNEVPFSALTRSQARTLVVFSGANAQLFTGTLRSNLDPGALDDQVRPNDIHDLIEMERAWDSTASRGVVDDFEPERLEGDERLLAALEAADAADVLDSLDNSLRGLITEKGRSLSGGQRQRVALARALLTAAPVLVLADPTSAVDSHTEARIGRNLVDYRRGLTTVISTTSPLLLDLCDRVVLLDNEGTLQAQGPHEQLRTDPRYRAIVSRRTDQSTDQSTVQSTARASEQDTTDKQPTSKHHGGEQ